MLPTTLPISTDQRVPLFIPEETNSSTITLDCLVINLDQRVAQNNPLNQMDAAWRWCFEKLNGIKRYVNEKSPHAYTNGSMTSCDAFFDVSMMLKREREKIAVANWKLEPVENERMNKVKIELCNGLYANSGLKQFMEILTKPSDCTWWQQVIGYLANPKTFHDI